MCTVLLPPDVYPIAVKYIIYKITKQLKTQTRRAGFELMITSFERSRKSLWFYAECI